MKRLYSAVCLVLALCSIGRVEAKEYRVTADQVAQTLQVAKAGDRILIEEGTYRDLELKWVGYGAEKRPIRIQPAKEGSVTLTGGTTLRLAGEWIEVEGLRFEDGYAPKGGVVEFRAGKEVANHCRLTNCLIDNYNPERRDVLYSYVSLYGRHNRVDHCSFLRKLNLGVTLYVILTEERSQENYHRVDHNWFGERPVYGSNGAETIRVGTSQQAHTSSYTLIEENLFERCNGEVEVVSIKSGDNTIRGNRFWECEGVLALRHGDRNIACDNIFVGNGRRNTGGIRVVNAGHRIERNRLYGLAGERFFSALALMNAVPNSLPNRYCLVEDVAIEENLFVDCSNIEFGTGKDLERTLAPERIRFARNMIINPRLDAPYKAVDQVDGFAFEQNLINLKQPFEQEGFQNGMVKITPAPSYEEMKQGCGSTLEPRTICRACTEQQQVVEVQTGEELLAAVNRLAAHSEVVLTLSGGDYAISHALTVKVPLTIRAAEGLAERPVIRYVGEKKENMLTIADGGTLKIAGVAFSGQLEPGKALAAAGISTEEDMIQPYTLEVDNCAFYDFGEGGFFAIRGTLSTFAERVEIRRSTFDSLSGDAIHYAAERDDKGRYNADDMLIEDCTFNRILGLPINIYRGGSDESTAGPYVTIRGCRFTDCCNKERGSVIRAIGPQVLEIAECHFENSGRGGASIRLDEASWEKISVHDCTLLDAGRVLSMSERVITGPMQWGSVEK